ncbi:MAG TPA: DUF167 family protein [Xanthobacteraceae bacterium]|nr:DUF167 family protein [Xanthobacteraceae bacterium]
MPGGQAWTVSRYAVVVTVRLTTKGGRDAIDGIELLGDGRPVLKARVRAAPEDGEANAALLKLMSQALDVSARQVSLVGGATARLKRVKIDGNGAALAATLEKIAAGTS